MRQDRDDPDDAMTPMAIAAKNGQKALFDLFLKWNNGQLVTTKVKVAQLYFLMEEKKVGEETEDRMAAFKDLLFSISEKQKKKVIRSMPTSFKSFDILQVSNSDIGGGTLLQHACEKGKEAHVGHLLSLG